MANNTIMMYDNKVWGYEVSKYGLKHGYLDYLTLSKMVGDCILNNNITNEYMEEWDIISGDYEKDYEIFQYYIITEQGANILEEITDEVVFYNGRLDVYVWGITHFGTSWDYVLTDVRLVDGDRKTDVKLVDGDKM